MLGETPRAGGYGGHCCPGLDTEKERDTDTVSERSREIQGELRGKEDDLPGGLT